MSVRALSFERTLAWILGLANAHPPTLHRSEFYALKDRLLRRWGRLAGQDIQRIVYECWGYEDDGECLGKGCEKCGGTGVFSSKTTLLERWELGERIFHRPARQVWGSEWTPNIHGRIRHAEVSHASAAEATLWLALFFDQRLFWRLLRSSKRAAWRERPLTALQALVFELWTMRFSRLVPRRCSCGRRFIRNPFGRDGWVVCRRCREWHARYLDALDSELPF